MKCDVKIMASKKRYANVLNMCKVLGLDVGKDVFFDDRPNGGDAAYTSRKTWELPFDDDVTHRCVLQDDLLLAHGFTDAIQSLVNKYPKAVFTLFCSSAKMVDIQRRCTAHGVVEIKRGGVWGQAIIAPKDVALCMYSWGERMAGGGKIIHDDVMIGEYAFAHSIDIYTTVPSLVQHLCPTNSLLGYNRKEKVSKVFCMDAGDFDWSDAQKIASVSIPNSMKFYRKV